MTKHEWEILKQEVNPLAKVAMPERIFNDLLQVLREADADLAGIYNRWDFNVESNEADADGAMETKKHIGEVYKALTGHDLEGGSSGDTK